MPNLQDIISEILDRNKGKGQWRRIADLQTASKVLIFLQRNHITALPQLQEKVSVMREQLGPVSTKVKAAERRLKTLDEHIKQAELYKEHRTIYCQYRALDTKSQESFYQSFAQQIILYETAKRYLDQHLNGHTLPLKAWKSEYAKLTAEKKNLYREYSDMKEEVREIEIIKRTVDRIMDADATSSHEKIY